MMNKKNIKCKYLTITAIILMLAAAVYLVFYFIKPETATIITPATSKKYTPVVQSTNPNDSRKSSPTPSKTISDTPIANTDSSVFSVQINVVGPNSGNIHIGTLVDGLTKGDCLLTASKPGQTDLNLGSSTIQSDVNNYGCGVFNVPTSTFTSSGTWTIKLTITTGTTVKSTTSEVVL